ncbi:MAG TPA: prolyl oligopeptidase family serine peptidase, partial [Gammaproteobacteria bacterium]|nr:prolyl oligopeptidase family serine peptidase [Gammaproteobacteria bacterium]
MKVSIAAILLAFFTAPVMAASPHPFDVHDLVMMDRVGDPVLSPDAGTAAFSVRETDYAANKGVTSVWVLNLRDPDAKPEKIREGASPQFSADGTLFFLADDKAGITQLWRRSGNSAEQASELPISINNFRISPDGRHVLVSVDVFMDCKDLACTRAKLDARAKDKATGRLYHKLFVRHWNEWMDGRRSQLFIAMLGSYGKLEGAPIWLTKNVDADIPSKPFGDNTDYGFSPGGKTVYFDAKPGGSSEAWSTDFNVYSVPADGSAAPVNLTSDNEAWDAFPLASADGKTLYYLAMKTPGFESDRFAIMARDLATGSTREVDPDWDRSAGPLQLSADGKTLYTTADDEGNHRLFAVDMASGKVRNLSGDGTVTGFAAANGKLLVARQDFKHPTDLYAANANGGNFHQLTHFNAARLANIEFADWQWFSFKGWNGDTVQGYVMQPVGYVKGRKYPIAFLIHGGPQGSWTDDFHYRWNPETYAGQGFAVVAINFHGSTGYGQAFTDSISQHWGDRPLIDLQKGWAAALTKFPFLAADRACAL